MRRKSRFSFSSREADQGVVLKESICMARHQLMLDHLFDVGQTAGQADDAGSFSRL